MQHENNRWQQQQDLVQILMHVLIVFTLKRWWLPAAAAIVNINSSRLWLLLWIQFSLYHVRLWVQRIGICCVRSLIHTIIGLRDALAAAATTVEWRCAFKSVVHYQYRQQRISTQVELHWNFIIANTLQYCSNSTLNYLFSLKNKVS